FFTPAHPASATVLTSWPGRSLRKARGTHSSSSTRIGDQVVLRLFQSRNSNFPGDRRKIVEKLVQRMTAFNVVDERLHRHTRANKHRGPAQNVGIGANDG